METEKINELIVKYNEGTADPVEIQKIEELISEGVIDLVQLRDLYFLDEQWMNAEGPRPSLKLDDSFYSMLESEKRRFRPYFIVKSWNSIIPWAAAAGLIIASFFGGYLMNRSTGKNDVRELTDQVRDLREMMLLNLLEKESVTERLKAVSLTQEMDHVSTKVTNALFKTLNQDENVNVRLSAMEALKVYAQESKVREELIRSIAQQDSPLVQIALAELMVSLQEKKSVKALEKIANDKKTPTDVKRKLKESIHVLI